MSWKAKAVAFVAVLVLPLQAYAGGLLRDAEIEDTLRAYADPIFRVADITPENVHLFLVDDPTINAFVAGGLNMFIHVGLIKAARTPDMLIGVMAHETGHIAGAHLSQFNEKAKRATIGSVIGAIAGVAVMMGGGGGAGAGILSGSQSMAQRDFLSGLRLNEQSADHAALTYLDALDISATGMLAMFERLRRDERGLQVDPFLQNHPLTQERIATMRNHVDASRIPAGKVPAAFVERHARMLAKLYGFTESYEVVQRDYPASDQSIAARYARAIADFRANKLDSALAGMQGLLKERPNDGYFYDTLGQMLFENAKLADARNAYQNAHRLLPNSTLIETDYAKVILAQDNPADLKQAIDLLIDSGTRDDSNSFTWRQLAIAYGKQGNLGESALALAKEAAANGDNDTVLQQVKRARSLLPDPSPARTEADDLERDANEQIRKKKEGDSLF